MAKLSIEISQELENELNRLAQTSGQSQEFFMREALTQYLEDVKDLHMALKIKKEKAYTTKELLDSFKSENV